MQPNTSYNNPIYSGESSRGDLVQNRGTKKAREGSSDNSIYSGESYTADLVDNRVTKRFRTGSHIWDGGTDSIQVKAFNTKKPTVSLRFDINKLSRFIENNSKEGKDYLEVLCIEARVVFIETWDQTWLIKLLWITS